jgi:hypothetical protein
MMSTARSARLCRLRAPSRLANLTSPPLTAPRLRPSRTRSLFSTTSYARTDAGFAGSGSGAGNSSYNVTDADIMALAKMRQHKLSLADLVKYNPPGFPRSTIS